MTSTMSIRSRSTSTGSSSSSSPRLSLLLMTMLAVMVPPTVASLTNGYKPNEWYTKYEEYPEYCSLPRDMFDRRIPPLAEWDTRVGETRLVHVTAVIRHGARTPWSSEETCWDGYWNATSDTSKWDCDLTTVMAPPAPNTVLAEEGDTSTTTNRDWLPDDAFFLFEKVFDALNSEEEGALTNELNGTCEKGQMLLQGYEQQIENGRNLRRAYGYYEGDYEHDERMRLFDLTYQYSYFMEDPTAILPWDKHHLYFRSDDDQRTIMSGQVLLRGLFDEEVMEKFMDDGTYPHVVVHTADRTRDIIGPSPHVCPRLAEIEEAAKQSDQYQAFNNSDQMEALRWFARDKLGAQGGDILDCLMTAICTDKDLPDAVNDYERATSRNDGDQDSMFQALAQADIMAYNLVMKYNNSEYAKLAMGPLWAEIMDNINPWLNQFDSPDDTPGPKLALYSGHDTTIMPLLASLDPSLWNDTDWAPYASMLLIEIHELIDGRFDPALYPSQFAFRLLYNGKVLTSFVPGCLHDAELCDTMYLKALVDPIATSDPACQVSTVAPPSASNEVMVQAQTLLNTTEGIFMFLGLVAFGMIVGGVGTHVLLTGRLPFTKRQVLESTEVDEDREARQGLQSGSNYFDGPVSDDDDDDDFVDATGGRVDSISTGLQ